MKKLLMSVIMCIAFVASSSVMAQDTTPKKECCKAKTECTKDKKECAKDKKECTKDKAADKKACCTKDKKADKK
ncbi:hypothetical protein [Dysgonomonas termitidis]|uniref:Uncharacterized protein n=1 Tax=Dysgonomonas termitidis TaxID=1516126 RepID=A0ABV9KXT8_9BACT